MATPLFELLDVRYEYGAQRGLQGVTFNVPKGARIALLGANGSGKSTLLRLLDGLYLPSAGSIVFDGVPLEEARMEEEEFVFYFRRRVALLFQDPDVQLFNSTVFDEVAFGPLQLRWPKDTIEAKVQQALQRLEIAELRDRSPHRLSGGEKKRVALASILILEPEVLLLDEPTGALDPRSQSQFIHLLEHLDKDKTVITATHDLDIVEDIADYCYVLESGRVIAEGEPSEVLANVTLLERANLIHAHHHIHGAEEPHYHPHLHPPHA
ncbi:MAG TPA: ABC transporter ATP-binding protein [Bryobacteraceae bacterium]|nr:ABC transporter ATP-binding protein [Bryobacteraceae bacterium]